MAVYTEISDEELARFIGAYGLGELLSYKGIAEGVENTNYLVHTTTGTFILTIYEKRVDPDDLPFFLGLMEHLSARAVTCPLPARDNEGNILNVLAGRHAAVITFLEGMWPKRPKVEHCLELGKALARMHVAGQDFSLRRVNALGLKGLAAAFSRRLLPAQRTSCRGSGALSAPSSNSSKLPGRIDCRKASSTPTYSRTTSSSSMRNFRV